MREFNITFTHSKWVVNVTESTPFTVIKDRDRVLTGRAKSTSVAISVKDLVVGDEVEILGTRGIVQKIEEVQT